MVVLLLTGASVGAVVEKLMSNKSDSELLLVTLDDDVDDNDGFVPCVVLRRDDIPVEGGGAISFKENTHIYVITLKSNSGGASFC